MKKVAILSYEGCWGMGIFSATDFFRIVALLEQHLGMAQTYAVEVLSSDGAEICAASGHMIQPDAAITDAGDYDLLIIPRLKVCALLQALLPKLMCWPGLPTAIKAVLACWQ